MCGEILSKAGEQRLLDLQEIEELRLDDYQNFKIYKKKIKCFHDSKILRKNLEVG